MNITEAKKFLEKQSDFCVERCVDAKDDDTRLKYSILADLYLTLACTLEILFTGDPAPHQLVTVEFDPQ
jgi:hypothetical protein